MEIVIGTRKWSTWSMRPWLALKKTGAPFTERLSDAEVSRQAGRIAWISTLAIHDGEAREIALAVGRFGRAGRIAGAERLQLVEHLHRRRHPVPYRDCRRLGQSDLRRRQRRHAEVA